MLSMMETWRQGFYFCEWSNETPWLQDLVFTWYGIVNEKWKVTKKKILYQLISVISVAKTLLLNNSAKKNKNQWFKIEVF